jgi:GNAT superfamily N-acetyltransferase
MISPMQLRSLPDGYDTRSPSPEDAQLVVDVVGTCEAAELGGEAQLELEDVLGDWRRPGVDVPNDGVFVIAPDGSPAAYAEVFAARAEGNVLPPHRGLGIGTFLAAWIERRAREVEASGVRQIVPAGAIERRDLLERAGYVQSDTAWELEMQLEVDEHATATADPSALVERAGIELRDFRPGIDDEAAFRVVEDAFAHWPGREPNSLDGWRAVSVSRAGFEPWMLPLAWDGDELVGVAYGIDYPDDGLLWVQRLAARVDRQGRGIGTALLHECFSRARARGRGKVGLSTDSRTGALGLYQRAGMQVVREFAGYRLALD